MIMFVACSNHETMPQTFDELLLKVDSVAFDKYPDMGLYQVQTSLKKDSILTDTVDFRQTKILYKQDDLCLTITFDSNGVANYQISKKALPNQEISSLSVNLKEALDSIYNSSIDKPIANFMLLRYDESEPYYIFNNRIWVSAETGEMFEVKTTREKF